MEAVVKRGAVQPRRQAYEGKTRDAAVPERNHAKLLSNPSNLLRRTRWFVCGRDKTNRLPPPHSMRHVRAGLSVVPPADARQLAAGRSATRQICCTTPGATYALVEAWSARSRDLIAQKIPGRMTLSISGEQNR
jgi:hypothetical protein